MTTKYFKRFNKTDGDLLDKITAESVKITGIETYYVPKECLSDGILYEGKTSDMISAYKLDVNLLSSDYFEGGLDYMNKFGFASANGVTFLFAQKSFRELKIPNRTQPLPGDLIYLLFSQSYFEITYMLNDYPWYPSGRQTTFKVGCEAWKYDSDNFNTGILEIDSINDSYTPEKIYDHGSNAEIKQAASTIRDESVNDIFGGL